MNLASPPTRSLRRSMERCRALTLGLFDEIDRATFCAQAHPDFSPIGWHLGHIAYTESLWILERHAGQPPLFPHYQRLFAADGLPKHDRVCLPTLAEILAYLEAVRAQVFEYLEVAPAQHERFWVWLLQHESQHAETIALVLELLKQRTAPASPFLHPAVPPTPQISIPSGEFETGSDAIAALDNERPRHRVYLEQYNIDRYPVTCGQYRAFMQAGGYCDRQWWTEAGWAWLQTAQVTRPLYWQDDRKFIDHPVSGVSAFEAEAYARFVGKRLPTEEEWEKAASWNPETLQCQTYPWGETEPAEHLVNYGHTIGQTTPVNAYPSGQSPYGCWDMLGNVWEWTASEFVPYPGFQSYPYRGYSEIYFDGRHQVLRGGSWATRSWALRSTFRNWYYPHVREVLAGFRCVAR